MPSPMSRKSKELLESVKRARKEQGGVYKKRSHALQKQEEMYRQEAYPKAGEIHSQYSDIAEFDPEAAERLTAGEYAVRKLPYAGTMQARKLAEAEEEEAALEKQSMMEELAAKQEMEAEAKEAERIAGVKVRARVIMWRKSGMDEGEIRLRLRRENLLKYYEPEVTSELSDKPGTLRSIMDFLQNTFTGGA